MSSPFRFSVGDFVVHKGCMTHHQQPVRELKYIIIARVTEECIGGTQYFYQVRAVVADGMQNGAIESVLLRLWEFEVEAAP